MARKRAIPQASRRALANRHGLTEPGTVAVPCHWCGIEGGSIHMWSATGWVSFPNLEMDHVIPEYFGGTGDPDNLVLACQPCNRSRGYRHAVPLRTGR